jgi:N-methylhydantoinase A
MIEPRTKRLAADIGGTFTDVAALDEKTGELLLGKTLSTPRRLITGITNGVRDAGTQFRDANLFLHGSTIAINTLLERSGARTALLTTKGFRDAYEIGRINRPDAYNLYFKKHVPLVERALRYEITERMMANGDILLALDEATVHRACDAMIEAGIEAVAILLLHCYANPVHEIRVSEIVKSRLKHAFVTSSHELSQEYREFERCSTTVANAYIGPRVSGYIGEIEAQIREEDFRGSFLIVQSTGGLYECAQAREQCVRMLESGPAAGVIGAQVLCRELGLQDAVAFDMGGTTAKAGVIHEGKVLTATTALIGGYNQALPIQVPMVDIFEVGTGGGSIAEIGIGDALRVGPTSAGAEPGPACYGLGGLAPTVTDANLVLGRLDANHFLGGDMRLDLDAAIKAIDEKIAQPLSLSREAAAEGIIRIAVTKMSYAVKGVSTERGLDAAAFAMIAYGGAGPLHASAIAREIGMHRVIIPMAPGHFCAFGMLHSNLRYDLVKTWFRKLEDVSFDDVRKIYDGLAAQGRASLASSNTLPKEIRISYAADVRYVGQEHAVTIDLPEDFIASGDRAAIKHHFDEVHDRRYGTCAPSEPAEVVSLRATVAGIMVQPALKRMPRGTAVPSDRARRPRRPVYFSETTGFVDTAVYDRAELTAGNQIEGPALIEEYASTTVVLPGDSVEVDDLGNLVISIGSAT